MEHLPEWMNVLRTGAGRAIAAGAACASLAGACTAQVETARPAVVVDDDVAVQAESAPPDVYAYPRTDYRGHAVYYVNGRWYYPDGRRWYYYRTEPPALVRHRRYVEQAPPARRMHEPRPDDAVRVR